MCWAFFLAFCLYSKNMLSSLIIPQKQKALKVDLSWTHGVKLTQPKPGEVSRGEPIDQQFKAMTPQLD